MREFERIKKECFWDLNLTDKDINDILDQDDFICLLYNNRSYYVSSKTSKKIRK